MQQLSPGAINLEPPATRSPVLRYLRGPLFLRDLLLVVLTLAALEGVCDCGLVDFDDPLYVAENCHTINGLSQENISWAFTTWHAANWHPLTWLSLQIDATFASPIPPVAFHRTNLLLHLANVLLLAELLRRLTGALWRSAAVAALFAVHPLHVESVAWVSERKDVLSTYLGLWALAGYVYYARKPSWGKMTLVLLAQAASLLAKPMLVTLPCLLLLLDFWPLRRLPWQSSHHAPRDDSSITRSVMTTLPGEPVFPPASFLRLLLEKLPLFLLSAASCIMTALSQSHGDSVKSLRTIPLGLRLCNSVDATVCYIGQMFWPVHLASYYPYPYDGLAWPRVLVDVLLLAGITAVVCWQVRRRPYLFVGWFWFVGLLVPVIGLVQVGSQARADRYTYLPLIGLFLMLAWGLHDLLPRRRALLAGLAAGALLVCLGLTRQQVRYWDNSLALWEHAVAVTGDNAIARIGYGKVLMDRGDMEGADEQFRKAADIEPNREQVLFLLGCTSEYFQRWDQTRDCFKKAYQLRPDNGNYREAFLNLSARKEARARQ